MLIIGRDKYELVQNLPDEYLFIDDGPLIDAIPYRRQRITVIDPFTHSYNPLHGIDYPRAEKLVEAIYEAFPAGETTLTRQDGQIAMMENLLLSRPKTFHKYRASEKDPIAWGAYKKVQRLLLSPVLNPFLTNAPNFPLDGIIHARIDRTVLSDFDAFVLANVLVSLYQGHVVVPDFGFYGCPFYASLIREGRLSAGVNFLDETPLKDSLLLMSDKRGRKCLARDAEVLAQFAGLVPDPLREDNDFNRFIRECVA